MPAPGGAPGGRGGGGANGANGSPGRGGRGSTGGGRGNNTPGPRDGNGRGRTDNTGPGSNTPGPRDDNGRGRTEAPSKDRGANGFAADTPGPRNASDGRRGSSMGRRGGLAGADGSTAASRAVRAFSRHSREGIDSVMARPDLVDDLSEKEKEGTLTPTEKSMREGMRAKASNDTFTSAISAPFSGFISSVTNNAPGVSELGAMGMESALDAATVSDNPAAEFGARQAEMALSNSTAQNVAEAAASMTLGPLGGMAVGAFNAAFNAHQNPGLFGERDTSAPGQGRPGSNGLGQGRRGTPSAARAAMSPTSPAAPQAQSFSRNPVDMTKYNRGLLSLAQSS